jgi:hypothetical protein
MEGRLGVGDVVPDNVIRVRIESGLHIMGVLGGEMSVDYVHLPGLGVNRAARSSFATGEPKPRES